MEKQIIYEWDFKIMKETDSKFKLCYFSPHYKKEIHEQILSYLGKIKETNGTNYDIINIRMKSNQDGQDSYPDEQHEKEIYETLFKPRARILNQRIGKSIRKQLRSNSGSYFIAGVIAVMKKNQVEWYTHYTDEYKDFDDEHVLGFLKSLLVDGNNLFDKIITTSLSLFKYESTILDNFISSGHLSGSFEREVRVGSRIFEAGPDWNRSTFDWRKSIDAVCKTTNEIWIIEAKRKLDYESIGEVLTYEHLYEKEHNGKNLRMAIVCGQIEEELVSVCNKYNITVFEVKDHGITEYNTN